MAPLNEEACLTRWVKSYMGQIAEQTTSRHHTKIAGSPELRSFLLWLSGKAPSKMNRLLKVVSRECEKALRGEEESKVSRKRADRPDRHERIAKRQKVISAAEKEDIRQDMENDDEGGELTKIETLVFQSDAQDSETAFAKKSASEKDSKERNEDSEEDPYSKSVENDLSTAAIEHVYGSQKGEMFVLPTKYQVESGLAMGSPVIEAFVEAYLTALKPLTTRPNFYPSDEISKIWKIIPLLEFYKTRRELGQHLESREKIPGEKLQARTNWDISDPSDILDAIENVKRSTTDNKIHRAYGQTMLVSSVDAQVARGYKSTGTGHRSDHMAILKDLACKKAGPVSKTELDQMTSSYFYEYHAGQKWLAVMDWFGGSGIVIVFVIVGVGIWFMNQWTEFQRSCVQHIAGLLDSIRRLVETLGPDALERYCREGCLGSECLERVKEASFTEPDTDGEESEDNSD